jgi:hypothetical protein
MIPTPFVDMTSNFRFASSVTFNGCINFGLLTAPAGALAIGPLLGIPQRLTGQIELANLFDRQCGGIKLDVQIGVIEVLHRL